MKAEKAVRLGPDRKRWEIPVLLILAGLLVLLIVWRNKALGAETKKIEETIPFDRVVEEFPLTENPGEMDFRYAISRAKALFPRMFNKLRERGCLKAEGGSNLVIESLSKYRVTLKCTKWKTKVVLRWPTGSDIGYPPNPPFFF